MEYWLSVIDEMADQTGVDFSDAQRTIAATVLRSAASVHSEYSAPSEPVREPAVKPSAEERPQGWWEDTSKLCGSEWVLAKQIQTLIASRYG